LSSCICLPPKISRCAAGRRVQSAHCAIGARKSLSSAVHRQHAAGTCWSWSRQPLHATDSGLRGNRLRAQHQQRHRHLLGRGNALLFLHPLLDALDRVCRLDVEFDFLACLPARRQGLGTHAASADTGAGGDMPRGLDYWTETGGGVGASAAHADARMRSRRWCWCRYSLQTHSSCRTRTPRRSGCASRETCEGREGAPAARRRSLRANAGAGDAGGQGTPVSVLTLICILRPVE